MIMLAHVHLIDQLHLCCSTAGKGFLTGGKAYQRVVRSHLGILRSEAPV